MPKPNINVDFGDLVLKNGTLWRGTRHHVESYLLRSPALDDVVVTVLLIRAGNDRSGV
jgi:hypothetical protein